MQEAARGVLCKRLGGYGQSIASIPSLRALSVVGSSRPQLGIPDYYYFNY